MSCPRASEPNREAVQCVYTARKPVAVQRTATPQSRAAAAFVAASSGRASDRDRARPRRRRVVALLRETTVVDEAKLRDRPARIEALFAGATTDGERIAAAEARRRIQARLRRPSEPRHSSKLPSLSRTRGRANSSSSRRHRSRNLARARGRRGLREGCGERTRSECFDGRRPWPRAG
jgi:hypothetical protein